MSGCVLSLVWDGSLHTRDIYTWHTWPLHYSPKWQMAAQKEIAAETAVKKHLAEFYVYLARYDIISFY